MKQHPLLFSGGASVSVAVAGQALRLNSAAAAYLTKTFPSAPTSRRKLTVCTGFKRGKLGALQGLFSGWDGASATANFIGFDANDRLLLQHGTGTITSMISNAQFRDTSAWGQLIVSYDIDNAVAANRVRAWMNGSEITSWLSTNYPTAQNLQFILNNIYNRVGAAFNGSSTFDGVLTRTTVLDGIAITDPLDFGSFTAAGEWTEAGYGGTLTGTNSFILRYLDTTSALTLGSDNTSNGNDFTPVNVTLADCIADRPTNNYCTLNPHHPSTGTLSNANLTSAGTAYGAFEMKSGVWYWEVTTVAAITAGIIDRTGTTKTFAIPSGVTYGILADITSGKLYYTVDGSNLTFVSTFTPGSWRAYSTGGSHTYNFGQGGFTGLLAGASAGGAFKYDPILQSFVSQTFTPGTYNFTIPPYDSLVVTVGGGGATGGNPFAANPAGGDSNFNNQVFATGGGGPGAFYYYPQYGATTNTAVGGIAGTASGGDINLPGNPGTGAAGGTRGYGGAAPASGAGAGGYGCAVQGRKGGSYARGGGGGSGGWAQKTYLPGDLTVGATVPITVGAGSSTGGYGCCWSSVSPAASGGNGSVTVSAGAVITLSSSYLALSNTNFHAASAANSRLGFMAKSRTGTGADKGIYAPFAPGLVWTKARSQAYDHTIFDKIRGATLALFPNLANVEQTMTEAVKGFAGIGFKVGNNNTVNQLSTSYVDWAWIDDPAYGVDIVTYNGTGAAQSVAHDLAATPKMILVKERDGTDPFIVYHESITSTKYLVLNSNAAAVTDATVWGTHTSTNVALGASSLVNEAGKSYIAYVFTEIYGFSAFGSYTGNGSSAGPWIDLPFRAARIEIKSATTAFNWLVVDSARDPFNMDTQNALVEDSANAEFVSASVNGYPHIMSNGFKVRGTSNAVNTSGTTYLYAAFAEHPLKGARCRGVHHEITPVYDNVLTLTPSVMTTPVVAGLPYSVDVDAAPVNDTQTFTIASGALPAGVAINATTGVVSGVPTAAGTYAFTIDVEDVYGFNGSFAYSIAVNAPTITMPTTIADPDWDPYTASVAASTNGNTTIVYSHTGGTIPPGLSLNTATGAISGTATNAGFYAFTIKAQDAYGFNISTTYTVTVDLGTIIGGSQTVGGIYTGTVSLLTNSVTDTGLSTTDGTLSFVANDGTISVSGLTPPTSTWDVAANTAVAVPPGVTSIIFTRTA